MSPCRPASPSFSRRAAVWYFRALSVPTDTLLWWYFSCPTWAWERVHHGYVLAVRAARHPSVFLDPRELPEPGRLRMRRFWGSPVFWSRARASVCCGPRRLMLEAGSQTWQRRWQRLLRPVLRSEGLIVP